MENDKYVVMKADEFSDWQRKSNFWWGHVTRPRLSGDVDEPPGMPEVLEDAVVIRTQDVFAGPGLFAYASAIQTALDIIDMLPGDATKLRQWEKLEPLRDFFQEQAVLAEKSPIKKVPD